MGKRPLFRASLAMSLDGYIADENGGVEWLNDYFSPEVNWEEFMSTIGATVLGRKTYDRSLASGMPLTGDTVTVLTHRPVTEPGVRAFNGDITNLYTSLCKQLYGTGKDVWLMGGGEAILSFTKAGLVDRFEIAVVPILLGSGIPMFQPAQDAARKLQLASHRVLPNGMALLDYAVPSKA